MEQDKMSDDDLWFEEVLVPYYGLELAAQVLGIEPDELRTQIMDDTHKLYQFKPQNRQEDEPETIKRFGMVKRETGEVEAIVTIDDTIYKV